MPTTEDGIPLVAVKPNAAQYCRTTSCLSGDPQESALNFVLNDDLDRLSNLLAEECCVCDDHEPAYTPLPDTHWINATLGKEADFKSLLHLAIEKKPDHLAVKWVRLMLSAGAKVDTYNEALGLGPIHVAVQKQNLPVVQLLLDFAARTKGGVAPNLLSSMDRNGSTPLHLAVVTGSNAILECLLGRAELEYVDPEDLNGRRTPLYLAAKQKNAEAARLLLSHGASLKNVSFGKTVDEVLKESMPFFDASQVKVVRKVARKDSLQDSIGFALNRILDKAQMNANKGVSNAQNYLQFITILPKLSKKEVNSFSASGMTLLQKSCVYGIAEFVECLLDHGADPNATVEECSSAPVLLAAYYGHAKVIKALLEHKASTLESGSVARLNVRERTSGESVLHWVLKKPDKAGNEGEGCGGDYEGCFDLLMAADEASCVPDELRKVINSRDQEKNTPLHYATQLWPQDAVRKLLEMGANIGLRNIWDDIPISKIMPKTIEDFLDEFCLTSERQVTHEDFELRFNYSFLAPPVDSMEFDETDEEGQKMVEKAALPETESLWYMSQSKQHRHLLKHPVVTSFLWLKWRRIYGYFNRNLRLYLLFVLCVTWYIFERYGPPSDTTGESNSTWSCGHVPLQTDVERVERDGFWYLVFMASVATQLLFMVADWRRDWMTSNKHRANCFVTLLFASWLEVIMLALMCVALVWSAGSLWYILTVLLVLLALREAFQMSVSLKRYSCTPENWLELGVIGLTGFILWHPDHYLDDPCEVKRHLAAVVIVLSWAELVTFVARHPRLARYNIYVTMFYKVLKTFLFFLAWYSFFIIAFGLGFFIMLHQRQKKEQDFPFFDSPWLSLVKTSTMFVGEIEFADLPVNLDGPMVPLTYLFLLAFVLLIIVVLMNLLNGLAVSDTGMIRQKAEIVSHISRVDTISYIESLMLGDPFDFLSNWPPLRWLQSLPSLSLCRCLYQQNDALRRCTHHLTGATGILIFYSILPDKTLVVRPNVARQPFCFKPVFDLPRDILDAAKSVVIEKQEKARLRRIGEKEALECSRIQVVEAMLEDLKTKMDKIMDALRIK